jgi:glycosyltransferase involved in cell wall biosynthesis
MDVSIIIPTYNRANYLVRAVASAHSAGDAVEIIVVDDASTDRTAAVCAEMSGIRYYRMPRNRGLSAARNAGIALSTRKYIAFLDDDDLRLPDSLAAQVALLEADPALVLAYGQVYLCSNQEGIPSEEVWPPACPRGDVFWRLLVSNFIPITSVVVCRDRLIDSSRFDTRLRLVEDWDLWLRLSEHHHFAAVPHPVAIYKIASAESRQMSSQVSRMRLACARVQARGLALPRARAAELSVRKNVRWRHLRRLWFELIVASFGHLLEADPRPVWELLGTALRLLPRATLQWPGWWPTLRLLCFPQQGLPEERRQKILALRRAIYRELQTFEAATQ